MADTLRRLVSTSSFSALQDKLDSWLKDYHLLSCDQNLNRCCELVELTARVQGQLFAVLSQTASEGGHYAGVETLKSRLLPWLGSCFALGSAGVSADTSLSLIQESVEKEKRIRDLSQSHEHEIHKMESQLSSTRLELDSVRQELRAACDRADLYKRKLDVLDDYERQIRLLKDEVSFLTAEKSLLRDRLTRSRSPSPLPRRSRSPSPLLRSDSPTRAQLTSSSRHARLLSRFGDLYSTERLEAQNLLRRYIDELEMVQRIIFIGTVESFHAAKMAYRQFKLRVRKTLSPTHAGPESLEDAVVDYIVRNLDLYDVQASVNDVISAMNVHPKISFPPEVDFILLGSFLREVCRVAFAMQTLEPPLDLAFSTDGELYSESKYRRSFDSEYSAPLVAYHVWPALVEGDAVIMKGEAVTRRGALWSPRRSRSRSSSPVRPRSRAGSPSRPLASSHSRSPSPGRL
ncbi:mitochondria-eating protein isoform X2 [Lepisosteus oculatus]|uniref:mitochondria-eating protein isoform X2 n=1 Tax=Lepisosteus oculatus TaxID=7918 RepID=UPI0035F5299C